MGIQEFTGGSSSVRRKLNDIVADVNALKNITGDQCVSVKRTNSGVNVSLSIDVLRQKLPYGGTGGGTSVQWATIIERPTYEIDGVPGRAYYTCRLITSQYEAWAAVTPYLLGAHAVYAELLYTAKRNNVNCQPDISPDDWEKAEEIKIEYASGSENIPALLNDCVPWFEAGEIVPLISRTIEEIGTRYYLWMTLTNAGTREQATLRYNPDEKITQAVFR